MADAKQRRAVKKRVVFVYEIVKDGRIAGVFDFAARRADIFDDELRSIWDKMEAEGVRVVGGTSGPGFCAIREWRSPPERVWGVTAGDLKRDHGYEIRRREWGSSGVESYRNGV